MHNDSISAAGSSRGQARLSAEVIESVSGLAMLIDAMAEVATEQGTDLTKLAGLIKSFSETSEYIGGQINGIVQEANLLAQRSLEGREILARVSEEMITTINQTGEINEVLLVISDISDRINLLSLNASIEAARAGDAGRGFAVVADEVSKLADQTANSVNDIGRMIEEKNRKLASNTDSIKLAVNNVEEVMIKVQDLSGNLKKIEKSVMDQGRMNSFVVNEAGKISNKSENIENTSIEQKLKIYETINVVQKVDALSTDILEKSDKLTASAEEIRKMTGNFRKFIEKIF
jgi:methyl-accepting chemotaxis protein